ncbi:MAG: amidohydrolase family protein [Gammaproteobacteria bacterium]|nr:amidohydrolase family protein [Gammaproteobacteria bacterium]
MRRLLLSLCISLVSFAAYADTVLIENIRIFNGVDAELTAGNVLVVDGLIATISSDEIEGPDGATVIAGNNRILTPGFIDLHVHLGMHSPPGRDNEHATVVGARSVAAAKFFLDHGFTTIRDAGGTHPDLARAFNSGELYGPRVFPSGAIVSQTAGHGDWRAPHDRNPAHTGGSPYLAADNAILADGIDATLVAVRENLKNGATQIKIMGGGGVMSDFDPIHSLQPSPAEIRAAVQAAGDWGTYVLAHAYTSEAVTRLVENGVKCIEHGLLIDDKTARLVAANNVAISTQLVIFRSLVGMSNLSDVQKEKALQVRAGQENLIRLIKKYDITTGFSTDFIFGQYQGLPREFTERAEFWSNAEVLRQATSESAEIIRMAGKLNRHGNFGEIREGWVADLLLHEGELLEDLSTLADPEANLALIMRAGEIIKRTL